MIFIVIFAIVFSIEITIMIIILKKCTREVTTTTIFICTSLFEYAVESEKLMKESFDLF